MKSRPKTTVAVLVATAHRTTLLESRALPSIARQSRPPERVVVVDDSSGDTPGRTERLVRGWRPTGIAVDFLRNRRTKGAAGAWNSGLDHLLRTGGDPERLLVAILDDDDRWEPHHLEICLKAAGSLRLDVVAAPFRRIEEGTAPRLTVPPQSLEAADFLTGNPGIQGSNLVCRLSVLLEAGLFDEALTSCTDRDLCIRLAELPGVRYGVTTETTVDHFACASRPRLSTPGLPAKQEGLDRFYRKYRGRMSEDRHEAFRARARRYFGWEETKAEPANGGGARRDSSAPVSSSSAAVQAPPHLIVGVIADTERLANAGGLLADLRGIAGDPGLSGLDVLILENGRLRTPHGALRSLVARERAEGLRVHLIDRARHVEDAKNGLVIDGGASRGHRLPIAPARTVLQSYLYAFAKSRPGAVVWIVDDDMRLDPLCAGEGGRLARRRQNIAPFLHALRRRRASGDIDIAIGQYTGAPPLPFASTVRVQLVDLAASLYWLAAQDPQAPLPDRSGENAALRSGRHDYHYDLSRKEADRLETPFLIVPAFPGESVGAAFERVAGAAGRILAGEQIFRPLAIEAGSDPLHALGAGFQRGGNTFVLDIEALRLAPNPSPAIGGRPSRRSDMIWALLQERHFGRRVVSLSFALYHDRSHAPVGALDVERIVDDVRGYAMFSALRDTPGAFATADDRGIALATGEIEGLTALVRKYLEERLAAFRLSFHRIVGLKRVLRRLVNDEEVWWKGEWHRCARMRFLEFCDRLDRSYTKEVLDRIERESKELGPLEIREFLDRLPAEINDHRERLSRFPILARSLDNERVANAKATVARLAGPAEPLTVLGSGVEGVALGDGNRVFKVIDYWSKSRRSDAPAFLRSLVGAWKNTRCLYPILAFHQAGHRAVLVYPYEDSAPYSGGHGPGMVELLAECRRYGIVCRNLHPANLRVVDGRVRLIDYGSDIHPLDDEREFAAMSRRAWLCYRWATRPDLRRIMRRALDDPGIPELDGFERFHEAVRRVTGQHETPEDVVLEMAGRAAHILDYGCGSGRLAKAMADRRARVLGYDPDRAGRTRWESRCAGAGKLRFTHDRNEALAAGPFDLVVCRRVLCTIEDDDELRAVLQDLRASVTEDGRVIVTVCDPHFTFGGPTPEADRELPPGARYESAFSWRKRIRTTGRVRRDVHRPERMLRRAFTRAGLAVCRRVEVPTVDLERFEPASDHLAFELRPLAPLAGEVALLVKACAMEAETLDIQIRHLVSQLEGTRAFAERILAIDSREGGFLRQHTRGDLRGLREAARRLAEAGWIDRVVEGPGDGAAAAALHRAWFGVPCPLAHAANGAQTAATLAGFEACTARYLLHVDADAMIGRLDRGHDYLAEMVAVLAGDPEALTVSFSVASDRDRPYGADGEAGPWRVETRAGMLDLLRLRQARPLPNALDGDRLALPWHRALDRTVRRGAGRSYRGGDRRTFFVHPPNARKRDREAWFAALDRLERGVVPGVQKGKVDWTGTAADWLGPSRWEPFVFVISGRNVSPGRLRRCLDSMMRQRGPRWGAVVFDDASAPRFAEHFEVACARIGGRCTVVRNRRRRGLLANMVTAIRVICTNPGSVIVTLDADDALIGDRVLERLAVAYGRGADATVGSMLRTDKATDYPVCFDRPRERRGGNVWQHLRSFRKRLFDAIPDDALRLDGEYVDLATDWAFMLPIVEMARDPVHIPEPLYLYEPSGIGKGSAGAAVRERIIARIVAKGPVVMPRPACPEGR